MIPEIFKRTDYSLLLHIVRHEVICIRSCRSWELGSRDSKVSLWNDASMTNVCENKRAVLFLFYRYFTEDLGPADWQEIPDQLFFLSHTEFIHIWIYVDFLIPHLLLMKAFTVLPLHYFKDYKGDQRSSNSWTSVQQKITRSHRPKRHLSHGGMTAQKTWVMGQWVTYWNVSWTVTAITKLRYVEETHIALASK